MAYDVREYGAVGDGIAKDTRQIQAAVDECTANGGGRVSFPPGTYLTGTIYLKNNVHLDIQPGAVILGSPDLEDYNAPDAWPQNWSSVIEKANGRHLIVGVEVSHVSISGGGRIDGNRAAFFDPEKFSRTAFPSTRPSQMLYFCESDNVTIENVELFNSPYWTCFLYGCDDVRLHALTIRNHMRAWNSDGLDIDSCARVTVSDCNIEGADDAIAIRGCTKKLKDKTRVCEDIVITNCILKTKQAGIRLGVGNGTIRRCCISNITMRDVGWGVCILTAYADESVLDITAHPKVDPDYGTDVSDVLIDNIFMNAHQPFCIMSNNNGAPAEKTSKRLRNITIRGVRGTATATCVIQGNHDMSVNNITLSDIDLLWNGGASIRLLKDGENCSARYVGYRPYAIYAANVNGLTLRHFRLAWGKIDGPWSHAFLAANTPGLVMHDCRFDTPPGGVSFEQLAQWNERL